MMEKPGVLHVYGQKFEHDIVLIVGNRKALERLKGMIEYVLSASKEKLWKTTNGEFMTRDGECYPLELSMNDEDWQSDLWKGTELPYPKWR